jgi:hypothetical protein
MRANGSRLYHAGLKQIKRSTFITTIFGGIQMLNRTAVYQIINDDQNCLTADAFQAPA